MSMRQLPSVTSPNAHESLNVQSPRLLSPDKVRDFMTAGTTTTVQDEPDAELIEPKGKFNYNMSSKMNDFKM